MTSPRPHDPALAASTGSSSTGSSGAGGGTGWAVLAALAVALAVGVTLVLATVGSFAISFGIGTDCTNSYSCSSTGCSPCRGATWWLRLGWLAQVGLLLGSVRLWVSRRRRRRGSPATTALALAVTATSVVVLVGTAHLAGGAYCRPGEPGGRSYCDVRAAEPAQVALRTTADAVAVEGVRRDSGG